jgi:DNA repair protein RadC
MEPVEITINYKPCQQARGMKKIFSSRDIISYLRGIWSDRLEYVEESYLVLLSRSNKILGYLKLSQGGTAGTVVDVKMIYQAALKANSHAIILAHNHPSGNLKPSTCDISLTKQVKDAGKLLDVKLFDHLIVTAESYFSFADEGVL